MRRRAASHLVALVAWLLVPLLASLLVHEEVARGAQRVEEEPSWPHPVAAEEQLESSPHPVAAVGKAQKARTPLGVPDVGGFVVGTGGVTATPDSIPAQKLGYALSTAAGVRVAGTLVDKLDYTAYVILGLGATNQSAAAATIAPERITIEYTPLPGLRLEAGYMRMPFSIAQAAVITQGMFPNRPGPTEIFTSGADSGFLAGYAAPSSLVELKVGVFDGQSLGLTIPDHVTRGAVLSSFVLVSPFGPMPPVEGDLERGKFRISAGLGALYRAASVYDLTGYDAIHTKNTRLALALNVAARGLFVQGELLRSMQTDDLSHRASIASGAYGQASYFFPVSANVALAPIGRLGYSARDQDFFPRRIVSLESGVAVYPHAELSAPGALRVVAEYTSERRIDEGLTAYGALLSGLLLY